MKLIFSSRGFTTDLIAKEVSKFVGKELKDISIAIINEAYTAISEDQDKRWLIKELDNIEKYIGGRIDFVNLRTYNEETIKSRLLKSDLIYIIGGKQHFLSTLLDADLIRKLANKRVVMGTSSGAILFGQQIKSQSYFKEKYNRDITKISSMDLGLVNFNIIPHYSTKEYENYDNEFLMRTLKDEGFPIYAINDEQLILYEDGKIKFIGGTPSIYGNGKI